jgi:hypothetical protein
MGLVLAQTKLAVVVAAQAELAVVVTQAATLVMVVPVVPVLHGLMAQLMLVEAAAAVNNGSIVMALQAELAARVVAAGAGLLDIAEVGVQELRYTVQMALLILAVAVAANLTLSLADRALWLFVTQAHKKVLAVLWFQQADTHTTTSILLAHLRRKTYGTLCRTGRKQRGNSRACH